MVAPEQASNGCKVLRTFASLILSVVLVGCSDSSHKPPAARARQPTRASPAPLRRSRPATRPAPQALVTAETENRLLVVDLRSGRITGQTAMPADPENVVAEGVAVVVSANAGAVTLLDPHSLRILDVLHGFGSPHIPAISPDGQYVYITDDARGTLTVIKLFNRSVVSKIFVGAGAHHLSFRPDERQLWIALSESARTIVILDTSNPARPRMIGRFDPGYAAHDLSFTPDGRRVWITSASGSNVDVFSSRDHRLLFRVPVGPPPQHVAFDGRYAYLTSGYGSVIEKVALVTGQVLKRKNAPYGSFELDAADGYVATSSLLRGTLAIYNRQLKLLRELHLAPATRNVSITTP
jgi:DNA-binding beta-propeller fold protein YncE